MNESEKEMVGKLIDLNIKLVDVLQRSCTRDGEADGLDHNHNLFDDSDQRDFDEILIELEGLKG